MNTPKHPIEKKLRNQLMAALSVTMLIIVAVSTLVNSSHRDAFVFQQLKDSATAKELMEKPDRKESDELQEDSEAAETGLWVAHFAVINSNSGLKLTIDPFTERLYSTRDSKAIEEMAHKATEPIPVTGKMNRNNLIYYYYINPMGGGSRSMVFYTTVDNDSNLAVFGIIFCVMTLAVLWISRRLAKSIVGPVRQLEYFAEEVARRNWTIPRPDTAEDEIGQLADALEIMRNSLKTAEELDKQFLQAASHDLKTPVMIIQGYAQELIDQGYHTAANESASVILEESTRLQRRIQQLLRYTTLGHALDYSSGWQCIQLDRLVRKTTERFSVLFPHLEWQTLLEPSELTGNPEALAVAVENLLENQSRFAQSYIRIQLTQSPEGCILDIANDGPPFNTKNPSELFEPFRTEAEGKFGLGLAIVKQVVTSHGGTAEARNTDTGVQFTLRFPKGCPAEEA